MLDMHRGVYSTVGGRHALKSERKVASERIGASAALAMLRLGATDWQGRCLSGDMDPEPQDHTD